jgi:hypothetical protein
MLDVFTTIPFQLLEIQDDKDGAAGNSKALRLARIPRLYRLLRIFRLFKLIRMFKQSASSSSNEMAKKLQLGNSIREVLKIIGMILFVTHLMACLWFFQSKMLDFPKTSWVTVQDLRDVHYINQYIVSFYWAIQTLLTIGYGDVVPGGELEMFIAICWMIAGIGFYSYTIGNMT